MKRRDDGTIDPAWVAEEAAMRLQDAPGPEARQVGELMVTAIKLVEDARNVDYDTEAADVQVIIVVEDGLRAYSAFLAQLYPELMTHAHSFIADGLNRLHRLLRMRSRPKILLAKTYEEAVSYFERHSDHVSALITDLSFPREGKEDADGHHIEAVLDARPNAQAGPPVSRPVDDMPISMASKLILEAAAFRVSKMWGDPLEA